MKIFSRWSLGLLAATLVQWSAANASGGQELVFEQAWIRAMPPGMKMTAGFGRLRNLTDGEIVIVGFSSPDFGEVSLHRTETVDGVSRMREVPELRLGPGETVGLEPGGFHLMLMMPADGRSPDQTVTVRMQRDDESGFEFRVPVERR